MKILLTYPTRVTLQRELDLIESVCKLEGIECCIAFPHSPEFKKYYKGGRPVVIVNDGEEICNGFWEFAGYILKKGTIRV